jgi:mannose-6-phosphate isomerase-like protein (cupin superfamily)
LRLLICGLDANGRSCIARETEIAFMPSPGDPAIGVAKLFETKQSPPPAFPPGKGKVSGGLLAPGEVSWYAVDHQPFEQPRKHPPTELHYRNAIDMVVILEGGGEMMLADGPHPVRAGDCIVMPGSDHALHPGPQGCRLMAFAIGTPTLP